LHIDSRKYYEDAIIRQDGLAQGHCCNHPVLVIFIPKRNFSRSIGEVEIKTVGKLQKNQVNGKGSRTSHDMKFAIVIELKYHNISQYKTKKNSNESKNIRENTKTIILTFSINARHWIHSGGPTSTPSDLFLTAVDRAKESVRKFFCMNNSFLKTFVGAQ